MSKNSYEKSIIDVLKSKIRFRIFSLLHLYPELSLSELTTKMNKSKSTIHHHLSELIESDLIEVSRQEKVRGNILAKFYSLKPGYSEKLNATDFELIKGNQAQFDFYKTFLNFAYKTLNLYKNFFEMLEAREDGFEYLKKLFEKSKSFSSMLFLSEEQFRKVLIPYDKFCKEVNKIEAEENGLKKEKPFYIFTMGVPLKQVIEEMSASAQIQKKQ